MLNFVIMAKFCNPLPYAKKLSQVRMGKKLQDRPGRRKDRDETGRRMTGKDLLPVAACCESWMSVAIFRQYFSQPWKTIIHGNSSEKGEHLSLLTGEMGDNEIGWAKN